jgi:hypothetical protein
LRRRLITLLVVTVAALAGTSVMATPAQAAWGPQQPLEIQLISNPNGSEYRVGKVTGSVRFDDGNSMYHLSIVICRQSSYTFPNVRVFANGQPQGTYSSEDGVARPSVCGDRWGMSLGVNQVISYPGLRSISVAIEGIHFDGSTAYYVYGGAFADNPFN